MATVMCMQNTDAAQQQTEPLRKAAQNLTCEKNGLAEPNQSTPSRLNTTFISGPSTSGA